MRHMTYSIAILKVKNYKLVGLGKPVKNENYVKKRTELEKKIKGKH